MNASIRLANKVINGMGGTKAVADLLEIKPPSVSEWRKTGIPKARAQTLQLLRPDLFPRKRERAVV
jgi:DNA-binding transcriptional regulator YdaS (Cro superfamily)